MSPDISIKVEETTVNPSDDDLNHQLKREDEMDDATAWETVKKIPRNKELVIKKELKSIDMLPPSITHSLLKGIPTYDIKLKEGHIDTRQHFYRDFIREVFGVNAQPLYPSLSPPNRENLKTHGFALDQFACMTAQYNPYLPSLPGVPGLYFGGRELHDKDMTPVEYWTKGVCRVFSRLDRNKWLYVGHYQITYGKTLSPHDWKNLPEQVRKEWIKGICGTNQRRKHQRIRIWLRNKSGCNREIDAQEYVKLKNAPGRKGDKKVTKEQVAEAFALGEEALIAWKMECVGYEERFQRKLIDDLATSGWIPPKHKKNVGHGDGDEDEDEDGDEDGDDEMPTTSKDRSKKRVKDTDDSEKPKKKAKRGTTKSHTDDDEPEYSSRGTRSRPRSSR